MAREQKTFFDNERNPSFIITDYDVKGSPMHWHNHWEMLLQCEGETRVNINGDAFVSRPGNVTIIEPNCPHATTSITEKHRILVVIIEKKFIFPLIQEGMGMETLPLLVDGSYVLTNRINVADEKEFSGFLQQLHILCKDKGFGYKIELYSCLLHIIFMLIKKEYMILPKTKAEKEKALLLVKNAIMHIDQNFRDEIRLNEMAAMCYISPSHFSRMFKIATGENMVNYVNKLRLNEALLLLMSSNHSILEISQMVGFSTVNYFNKVFKAKYNCSPREYKNKKV